MYIPHYTGNAGVKMLDRAIILALDTATPNLPHNAQVPDMIGRARAWVFQLALRLVITLQPLPYPKSSSSR